MSATEARRAELHKLRSAVALAEADYLRAAGWTLVRQGATGPMWKWGRLVLAQRGAVASQAGRDARLTGERG